MENDQIHVPLTVAFRSALTQKMLDKLADKIQSGEIVFDPAYTIDENGRMVITEVSLIPYGQVAHTQKSNRT